MAGISFELQKILSKKDLFFLFCRLLDMQSPLVPEIGS